MTARYVYRCYAGDGSLLYVGSTRDLGQRLLAHTTGSVWASLVARVRATVHSDLAGRAVERDAIRTERPRFNIHGRWSSRATWSLQDYDDYLFARSLRPETAWTRTHLARVRRERSLVAQLRAVSA